VVQPIEQVGGKWVAYGMGNSLSNQTPACCAAGSQDGVLVQVTIARDGDAPRVRAVRYVPTWVEHPSFRVRPVPAALADRSLTPQARQALEASRDRTRRAVGPAVPPPAPS
jgi:poly-gamma-glutamate synthesis protein (capsule biosynthesis protein)